ncbi:MAG: bile acid:sodium symporter family protein [Allosphingosinicella sp.]
MSPSFVGLVNTVWVPIGLMLIMFSMGLTLTLGHFALVLRNLRTVATGLGGQLVLMPLLALAIGLLFRLSPELALGMFIVAICPAGTTSNALTFIGRGNVALAVVLTALSSLVTVFTIPLLLSWALPWFLGGGGEVPTLSIPTTIRQLATITILPIAVGMIVRRLRPAWADRLVPWLRPVSFVVLVGVIVFAVAISAQMVLANLLGVGPAVWTLNVAAMLVGWLLGTLIGANQRDRMTLAIEVGVHNVTLAIFLTLTVLQSLPLALTQNIYGVVMLFNGTLLVRWLRARMVAEEAGEVR